MKPLRILNIAGDSYSGKDALTKHLTQTYPDLFIKQISYTSRKPRDGELDGVDYHFRDISFFEDSEKFEEMNKVTSSSGETNYYASLKKDFMVDDEKILLCIRDGKGVDEFLTKKEICGREVTYNKLLLFDIDTESIEKFILKLRYEGEINKEDYKNSMNRLKRFDFKTSIEQYGLISKAGVVRKNYYELDNISDIIDILPHDIKEKVLQSKSLKRDEDISIHRAYIEIILMHSHSDKKIYNEAKNILDSEMLLSAARRYEVDPFSLKEYIMKRIEYPLVLLDENGNSQTYCRISNQAILEEMLSESIDNNEFDLYSLEELKEGIFTDVYTPFGTRDTVSLNRIAKRGVFEDPLELPLDYFNISSDRLEEANIIINAKKEEEKAMSRDQSSLGQEITYKNIIIIPAIIFAN